MRFLLEACAIVRPRTYLFASVICVFVACDLAQHAPGADDEGNDLSASRSNDRRPKDCKDVARWMSDAGKGFIVERRTSAGLFQLQYRPALCAACMEQGDASLSDRALRERTAHLRSSELYFLRFTPAAGTDPGEAWEHLRSGCCEVLGVDTVPCAFVHVESLPAMSPYREIMLGFDRPQDERDRTVILRSPGLEPEGGLMFHFDGRLFEQFASLLPDTTSSSIP